MHVILIVAAALVAATPTPGSTIADASPRYRDAFAAARKELIAKGIASR